ncbi:MAG TPA: hypothetical protein VFI14_06745, partial [Chryseosolibacter sp.]|nr:hypothetical protein [Chryseosolibacter sp.]
RTKRIWTMTPVTRFPEIKNSVDMVGHYDGFIQNHKRKMFRYVKPILVGDFADRRQSHDRMA